MSAPYCWVNRVLSDSVNSNERALHFGDGLFETIRLHNGHAPLLDFHLARLQYGLDHLAINLSSEVITDDIALAIEHSKKHPEQVFRLKYLVSRGCADAPYRLTDAAKVEPSRIMSVKAFDRDVAALQNSGVKAQFCQWPVSKNAKLAGLKHLNRLDQVMASQELADDVFEGLMLDDANIIEGTFSNLLMRDASGQWLTPELNLSGVEGVMRDYVINTLLPEMGFECAIKPVNSLGNIRELYLMNAMMGIIPVKQVQASEHFSSAAQKFIVSEHGLQLVKQSQQLFTASFSQ